MAQNLWNDQDAAGYLGDLALRVYTSRLLGRDPALVLHGGGNTSVKIRERNVLGEEQEVLYVKGSGWDLATIEAAGFTPIRMDHLLRLARLDALSDLQMVNELKTHQIDAAAPAGSVEAILHAVLPYRYVDHTHADALIALTNTPEGEARVREACGDSVVVIPYVMPGFDLARVVAQRFPAQADERTMGMVLMSHGLFSFGATARESYERMIVLVNRVEDYLKAHGAWDLPEASAGEPAAGRRVEGAELRLKVSEAAGFPMVLRCEDTPEILACCRRDDLTRITQQGPATPDHVIRTKRTPLLGRDVAGYVEDYRAYFAEHAPQARTPVTPLDPAPRVILDPALGMLTAGRSAREAVIVADIYRHTMQIIQRAERLGGWQALPARDIFDVEYWELEQAKLRKSPKAPVFQGEIALVTGAASGIGRACVGSLLQRGAAVVGLDVTPATQDMGDRPDLLSIVCDVTDTGQVQAALDGTVHAFGGLDILILNAGLFPGGTRIAELDEVTWRRVMAVNLDANLNLLRDCYPLLKLAPRRGRVVVIGSKNVPAPGPGAAAYSASKAALTQLMRVAALEWGLEGMRVNALHPDAVFDTGVWTEEILAARASHHGMTVEQYKTKNLLRTEVRSRDVAELAAEMCGPLFAKTTGAQVPVDGGNDRVV
jgi:rhamnose utilization protein RhaD (predicted bifunctional aldolase and dehydrogenase)/NAD(P)-dependent dehydrogenase (short-subunit alcohol dehydrogenase family)